jgi:hypothetical protein
MMKMLTTISTGATYDGTTGTRVAEVVLYWSPSERIRCASS